MSKGPDSLALLHLTIPKNKETVMQVEDTIRYKDTYRDLIKALMGHEDVLDRPIIVQIELPGGINFILDDEDNKERRILTFE